jgi:hypothetical protein
MGRGQRAVKGIPLCLLFTSSHTHIYFLYSYRIRHLPLTSRMPFQTLPEDVLAKIVYFLRREPTGILGNWNYVHHQQDLTVAMRVCKVSTAGRLLDYTDRVLQTLNIAATPVLYSRVVVSHIGRFFCDSKSDTKDFCESYNIDISLFTSKASLLAYVTHITLLPPWRNSSEPFYPNDRTGNHAQFTSIAKAASAVEAMVSAPNLRVMPRLQTIVDVSGHSSLTARIGDYDRGNISIRYGPKISRRDTIAAFAGLIHSLRPPILCTKYPDHVRYPGEQKVNRPDITLTNQKLESPINYIHLRDYKRLLLYGDSVNIIFCRASPHDPKTADDRLGVSYGQNSRRLFCHYLARSVFERFRAGEDVGDLKIWWYGLEEGDICWWKGFDAAQHFPGATSEHTKRLKEIITLHLWEDRPICLGCGRQGDKK